MLNVILFPPGELAKGSFFFFFGGGSDMGGIYRVYLRFDFYEPFCTGIHGCLSSLDLFTEMVKQSWDHLISFKILTFWLPSW